MYTSLRNYLQTCAPYKVFKQHTESPYKAFINIPLNNSRLGEFSIRWKLTRPAGLDKEQFNQTCSGIETNVFSTDDVLSIKFNTFLPREIINHFVADMKFADTFANKYLSQMAMDDAPRELIICLAVKDCYHTLKFHTDEIYNTSHETIMSIFPEAITKDHNYYTCETMDNENNKYRFSILKNQRFINLRHYEEGFHGIRSISSKEGRNNTEIHS